MLLAVLLTGLIAALAWNNDLLQATAAEPGYLDFDNLPETNFSCEGKVIGGYYADVETGCQMFHVCTIGQKGEVADIKFLCLNGTVFDQETRVCERLDEVDCSKSESYYDLNLELYGNSGATYGIQPENEEESPTSSDNDEDKCNEDEDDCKTEPQMPLPNKPAELEDEYEELEEVMDPTTSSTTSTTTTTTQRPTRRPLNTSSRPAQVSYPTSSPETIAALLALHNAFQESLKEHEGPPPPRVNNFPSPAPPQVKTPPPPPRFSSPVSFSTSPRPLSFAQNFPGGNHQPSLPQQPQVSNHHFPAPQSHKQPLPQPFPFNVTPKTKQSPPAFTSTIRTSQAFGNSNFQQSFREEQQQQQQQKLQPQEEDEEYSVEDYDLTLPSSPRPLYNAYKHNQNRFAISHQDTNPNAAPSNFLLHQIKLRFNDNPPQKHPGAHGFTRAISNHDTKILTYPEKPLSPVSVIASSTTPAAVSVILSKTSTTSVVRSVRNQSAISNTHSSATNASKVLPASSTQKPSSQPAANNSHPVEEDYKSEEEYDYYQEDLGPDPFYKDVPKLERQKRSLQDETDLNKLKRKYSLVLKKIMRNKYPDSKKLAQMEEKIDSLDYKILAAEAQFKYTADAEHDISNISSHDEFQTTTEEEISNGTFPTVYPPTPPSRSEESPDTTLFSFTLRENISYGRPFDSTRASTPTTRSPVRSHVTRKTTVRTNRVSIADLIKIPEDVFLPYVTPKGIHIHEDYFGSISPTDTESLRELLSRIRTKSLKKSHEEQTRWFTSNDTTVLLGDHFSNFSESLCSRNDFYNKFVDNLGNVNNPSSPDKLLVGTRYMKLCKCVSQSIVLVFLIETKYFLDPVQYRRVKEDSSSISPRELVDIIELKSRIKILQRKRGGHTFKVIKEMWTGTNPRLFVKKIVETIEEPSQRTNSGSKTR